MTWWTFPIEFLRRRGESERRLHTGRTIHWQIQRRACREGESLNHVDRQEAIEKDPQVGLAAQASSLSKLTFEQSIWLQCARLAPQLKVLIYCELVGSEDWTTFPAFKGIEEWPIVSVVIAKMKYHLEKRIKDLNTEAVMNRDSGKLLTSRPVTSANPCGCRCEDGSTKSGLRVFMTLEEGHIVLR